MYNRAMVKFTKEAGSSKLMMVPGAYHEILFEKEEIRLAALRVIDDFFNQADDNVAQVKPCFPLSVESIDTFYSYPEVAMRMVGVGVAIVCFVTGLAMVVSDKRR